MPAVDRCQVPLGSEPRLRSNRAWRHAFPAGVVSTLGDVIFDLTVVLWISTDLARGQSWAPMAVSGVLMATALPVLLVGPVAGVFADRTDRHRLLLVSNAVQAAAIGSLLLIPALGDRLSIAAQLGWILAAILVSNAAGQFFRQAWLAMIAKTIPDLSRTRAFSALGSAMSIMHIIGPPLAAPLLFVTGVGWALTINAASFLASSLLLSRVRWDSAPEPAAAAQGFVESLWEGAKAIAANRVLLAITVAITVVTFGTGAITVMDVFFVTDVLHQRASLLGILAMSMALGSLVGMAIVPRIERWVPTPAIFLWGLLVAGALFVVYSRVTHFGVAIVVFFLAAVPVGAVNAVLTPLAMRSVPAALLGRSMAVLSIFPTIASLIAMALTGWVVSTVLRGWSLDLPGTRFGPVDSVFTIAGLLMTATALAVWRPIAATAKHREQ